MDRDGGDESERDGENKSGDAVGPAVVGDWLGNTGDEDDSDRVAVVRGERVDGYKVAVESSSVAGRERGEGSSGLGR